MTKAIKRVYITSDVSFLFKHSPSRRASEVELFEIFSRQQRKSTCPAICEATFLLFFVFLNENPLELVVSCLEVFYKKRCY